MSDWTAFTAGYMFESVQEFRSKLNAYQRSTGTAFSIVDSKSSKSYTNRIGNSIPPTITHVRLAYQCVHNKRRNRDPVRYRNHFCPAFINLGYDSKHRKLKVVRSCLDHNHPTHQKDPDIYPANRSLQPHQKDQLLPILQSAPLAYAYAFAKNNFGIKLMNHDLRRLRLACRKQKSRMNEEQVACGNTFNQSSVSCSESNIMDSQYGSPTITDRSIYEARVAEVDKVLGQLRETFMGLSDSQFDVCFEEFEAYVQRFLSMPTVHQPISPPNTLSNNWPNLVSLLEIEPNQCSYRQTSVDAERAGGCLLPKTREDLPKSIGSSNRKPRRVDCLTIDSEIKQPRADDSILDLDASIHQQVEYET